MSLKKSDRELLIEFMKLVKKEEQYQTNKNAWLEAHDSEREKTTTFQDDENVRAWKEIFGEEG